MTWLRALLAKPVATNPSAGAENSQPDQRHTMPDIYSSDDVDTQPALPILDVKRSTMNESPGFNPYDTGVLRKK